MKAVTIARPASPGAYTIGRIEALDIKMRRVLVRVGPLMLRVSLGIVFVWFGALKVAGESAVGGLVASTVPFLDSAWLVPVLGVLEILMGLAFTTGRLLRIVLPMFALHMGGTLLVLLLLPDISFEGANPLLLTIVGEFVVKNLVLLSAGLVVASTIKPLRRRLAREPDDRNA
jgi:putative oxidoreductase